jgi:vacuolar-type H+-ATPase subunit E/Vma4
MSSRIIKKGKVWTYQYGEYKIELKDTFGNFEVYANGEVIATTKDGKIKIQFSSDVIITGKLPNGEEILAIKSEKLLREGTTLLFVGQQLTPQSSEWV